MITTSSKVRGHLFLPVFVYDAVTFTEAHGFCSPLNLNGATMLDQLTLTWSRLGQLTSDLCPQTVDMHKEKVFRREIGVFTAVRRVPRSHKILPPTSMQPRPSYSRKPINYQQLDSLGHGMKVTHTLVCSNIFSFEFVFDFCPKKALTEVRNTF